MGTVTVQGRDELGRLIDVTLTTTADVPPPGPETAQGGGLSNPITEPVSIEPTNTASSPLQIVPPSDLPEGSFVLNVKDVAGSDAFTVGADGQIAIIPQEVSSGAPLLTLNDGRAIADFETVLQIARGASSLLEMFTAGEVQFQIRHVDASIRILQPTASTRPLVVHGTSQSTTEFAILSGGAMVTHANSAPADGSLSAGEMAIWFDSTNGSAKLKIKGKSANGTVVAGEVALA